MSTAAFPDPTPVVPALSEGQRLADTFVAPSKTFADIRRSAAWWAPFVVSVLVSLFFVFTIQTKIGWEAVTRHQIALSHQRQSQIDSLPADQQQVAINSNVKFTRIISYVYPVFGLIVAAIVAGIFMLSCNFGFGAKEPFSKYFAVWMYGTLPFVLKALLATILLWAGVGADNFDMQNMIGTNPAYYMDPGTSAAWLRTFAMSLDIFTIWVVVLLTLGLSIVARVSRGAAAAVVVGWWLLVVLFGVAAAAMTS